MELPLDGADQLRNAVKTNSSSLLNQDYYTYDSAGNRSVEQQGLSVTQTGTNSLNQVTGTSAGGPLQFSGTLNKPGTVTVAGNSAKMDSTFQKFAGSAAVTTGTNNVPLVATSASGYASTNSYQVVVASSGTITPSYDANGNLTSNGSGQAYTWDAQNELMSIVYSSGANSGNHTEFAYDGLGRRIQIVERTGATIGTGTITSTKQFVWVGSAMQEERDATNTVTKRFFAQGEQVSGSSNYYTRDHLGSVREMTNSSNALVCRLDYDPWGRVTVVSGTTLPDFQFAGYYEHGPSGLNLTLFRAYDPNTAKWLSRDPIGERLGINLYNYCANNCLNSIDPLGASALSNAAVIGGLAVVTVAALVVASPVVATVAGIALVGAAASAITGGNAAVGGLAGAAGAAVGLATGNPYAGGAVAGSLSSGLGALANGQGNGAALSSGIVGGARRSGNRRD